MASQAQGDAGSIGVPCLELWLTVALLAHLASFGFLLRAWALTHQQKWAQMLAKIGENRAVSACVRCALDDTP